MLTRLKVSGFKNLVDVDVRFGPFTCIAGANGVGKSNLFDAIQFLSALASRSLSEAALSVREEGGNSGDIKSLFHRVGHDYVKTMVFEAEMIVPEKGIDDLGQPAQARITFLRYSLELAYREDSHLKSLGRLEILREELGHINRGDAAKHLLFSHTQDWRKSALQGAHRSPYFISTGKQDDGSRIIKLHQDGGTQGRPLIRLASTLPRTVLSVANAAESPTALMARREMQSWRLLQLEPSALRQSDKFTASTKMEANGSHLAATLYHLAKSKQSTQPPSDQLPSDQLSLENEEDSPIYYEIANRLATLIGDVEKVWVDQDDVRELLTLMITTRDGTPHPAKSLSDGTMRFLALAVLSLDQEALGLICLEEPENGIHPERIPKILQLLQEIATNTDEPLNPDNPLRQVIINTHSPAVVAQIPDDSLIVAELQESLRNGQRFKRVHFGYLPDTWRHTKDPDLQPIDIISKGKLLAYLNPIAEEDAEPTSNGSQPSFPKRKKRRVIDREDLYPFIPGLVVE